MSTFWSGKRILVTGGAGFLGSQVVAELYRRGVPADQVIIPRSREYDLRIRSECDRVMAGVDIVIHLAARVGGIGYNQAHPAELFYDNLIMGAQLMETARLAGFQKFVAIGLSVRTRNFLQFHSEKKISGTGTLRRQMPRMGLAKKMLLVQAQAYRQQYGFNAINQGFQPT